MLVVYLGGHGASSEQMKQIYLLNEEKAKDARYDIEFWLRYLVNDPGSMTQIFAIFNCCRVPIYKIEGFEIRGRNPIHKIEGFKKRGIADGSPVEPEFDDDQSD